MLNVSTDSTGHGFSADKQKMPYNKMTAVDLSAAAVFVVLAVFLFMNLKNGIGVPDESFYLTIPHRVFGGDGLISDEWHVSQFSSFIQYPFYVLFRRLTGSTDGIILFFRYLYVFFQLSCTVVCWSAFRKYGFKGLAGLACFAFFIPVTVMSVSYHTVSLWISMILASAFLRERKPGRFLLFLYGVLIALGVLSQPLTAVLWFAYTAAVCYYAVRMKRKGIRPPFPMRGRTFLYLLSGILLTAALFLLYLFKNNSLSEIFANIGYLFTEENHNFISGDFLLPTQSVLRAVELYGIVPSIGIAVLTVLTAAAKKYRETLKPFFAAALLFFTVFSVIKACRAMKDTSCYTLLINYFGIPVFLAGPVCMLLLRSPRKELTVFWWFLFFVGLLTDISSDILIGSAAVAAGAASVILLLLVSEECIKELRQTDKAGRKTAACVTALCLLLTFTANAAFQTVYDINTVRKPLIEAYTALDNCGGKTDTVITDGPLKGIRTTATIGRIYSTYLADLDTIASDCGGAVYIYGLYGYLYLYLCDTPSAAYSAWHTTGDEERMSDYFDAHPDKQPEYIYIPFYYAFTYRTPVTRLYDSTPQEKLDELTRRFDCEVEKGKAGYIVRIRSPL